MGPFVPLCLVGRAIILEVISGFSYVHENARHPLSILNIKMAVDDGLKMGVQLRPRTEVVQKTPCGHHPHHQVSYRCSCSFWEGVA